MADHPGPSGVNKQENTAKNTENQRAVDFFSEKFDPLAVLYSDKVNLPHSKAKPYDNLAMWNSKYQARENVPKKTKKTDQGPAPQRNWLPHQLPVASKKRQRIEKNVFTRMDAVQGPLALLRKYVKEKTRIKIVTRNDKGVRGYCTAFLLAFDKHFNLALDEVEEFWKRSIKTKFTVPTNASGTGDVSMKKSGNHVQVPPVKTKQISKNTEECQRYVQRMVMRGEHVVLICALLENT
ncbi:U7 snRNA-associated Sm-like protein LSm11 [Sitophilus oryzae]|uniref:U7 snRNA-associated Sm-like protein LSm11 n=1 Tax=Sitophilus oryzae TaxID=7048 RepID=A0A6J2XZV5_SITOR|nr:U7 snRNA-associated Sm-like protein LSm11 [Sitophilus oryzae]